MHLFPILVYCLFRLKHCVDITALNAQLDDSVQTLQKFVSDSLKNWSSLNWLQQMAARALKENIKGSA